MIELVTIKKEGFLKIISIFSFLGIALGVAILIIVMSVFPGKGGQKFINTTYNRIKELGVLKKENNFKISVDGGVNDTNSHDLIKFGSDILVSGSFLIKNSNLNKGIKSLLNT